MVDDTAIRVRTRRDVRADRVWRWRRRGNKVASINGPKSSESAPPGAANAASDEEKHRAFTKCMREHGIDMKDSKPAGPGGEQMGEAIEIKPGEEEKMNAANEACRKLLPNGGERPKLSPEELDKQRNQAKCMREHGIDWPDPDDKGGTMNFDMSNQDKMDAAMKACGMGDGMKFVPMEGGK